MKILLEEIPPEQEEEIVIKAHAFSDELLALAARMRLLNSGFTGECQGALYRVRTDDIYYFEVVDSHSFLYCRDRVLETRLKLYEFEEQTKNTGFFRCSKSVVLNSDRIDHVLPSYSGRFEAVLDNGEKVMVSRQYVPVLKKKIGL